MILPVILAGGNGSRLWPLSRASYPKQFLNLINNQNKTLLQETILRLSNLHLSSSKHIIICNEKHRFLVAEQLNELGADSKIFIEPVGRNTAPAIALSALNELDQDPLLLVLAADHFISDKHAFHKSIKSAVPFAQSGKIVVFGVTPDNPHTGYGYIEANGDIGGALSIKSFKEKPDIESASRYLKSKKFYWNSGIFLFKASTYLEELKKYRNDIYEACSIIMSNASHDLDFVRFKKKDFIDCPDESIDYAIMEKTLNAVMVPMNVGWSDIGSWSSVWLNSNKDKNENVIQGDAIAHDTKRSYLKTENKLLATVGIQDMIVISTKDSVLVAHKDNSEDLKLIVDDLKVKGRSEFEISREVFRPWGSYDLLDKGEGFQVKRLMVKPGHKLSLQKHNHRAEHWVVVSGLARVTRGNETFELSKNESTYIPIGVVHSLENAEDTPLEIIEVQSGSYLGEDDIVRLKDRYGRIDLQ